MVHVAFGEEIILRSCLGRPLIIVSFAIFNRMISMSHCPRILNTLIKASSHIVHHDIEGRIINILLVLPAVLS